ncbi:PadR family transcriptional regulator [Amycolatopsis taiwanensis]|uniref:PadR family transcriptional regulator n=2 Tax=Amycolatopsis taiwanensis TaxID=342230 RepID=A0A9W6R3M7_9PSEU|nr:PadR family transcriptional regulator [Amycolatopsis taiwanensis]
MEGMVPKQRKVANPLALFVLAELMPGPTHPYELGRLLTEHGKDRNVRYTRSSLYTVVNQLLKAGFIAEQETVRDTQRPERTIYTITETGRSELRDWLRELIATPRDEYPQFVSALSLLMVLPPDDAIDLLGKRLAILHHKAEAARAELDTAAANGIEWIYLVDDQYRLAALDFERQFVTGLIDSLKDPAYQRKWHEMAKGMA